MLVLGQSFLSKFVAAAAGVGLARLLVPRDFGLYAIAAFITTGFSMIADIGLGAALIQQPDDPTPDDLGTTFGVQLGLALLLAVAGFVAAIPLASAYHLQTAEVWLIRAMLFTLLASAIRTVPALLLERDLLYGRLAAVETAEAIVFSITAVAGAWLHMGVWSFAIATVVRGVVGNLALYTMSSWRPRLAWSVTSLRRLAGFGVLYQLQTALGFAKDAMIPTFVAIFAGAVAVGYVSWAFSLAMLPLPVALVLGRISLPAFSRASTDRVLLVSMVERSIRLSAIAFLPLSCLLIAAAPELIHYVYSDKWLPALPSVYLFSVSFWAGPLLGASFFSLFYASGHAKVPLYFTLLYTVLDWTIGIPLVRWLGFTGVALRTVAVAYLTLPLLLWQVRKIAPIRATRQVVRPALLASLAGVVEFLLLRILPGSLLSLVAAGIFAALIYIATISVAERGIIVLAGQKLVPLRMQPALRWYLRPTAQV